jgi:hypothetical protein
MPILETGPKPVLPPLDSGVPRAMVAVFPGFGPHALCGLTGAVRGACLWVDARAIRAIAQADGLGTGGSALGGGRRSG